MNDWPDIPFHAGEQALQARLGVQAQMAAFGRRVIRDHMPEQHRAFYRALPYVFIGHQDAQGAVWASMLCGESLLSSADEKTLSIHSAPSEGDPLQQSWAEGQPLGILGLDLSSRRRNRLSGRIQVSTPAGIELRVDQCFGNCPKYIQARAFPEIEGAEQSMLSVQSITQLGEAERALIQQSDTFFVASAHWHSGEQAAEGVDISHRGGPSGFVQIDESGALWIPDYAGNRHFNTLGNLLLNPQAGLLFVDFVHGHLLQLTGQVAIHWDKVDGKAFPGAERLWRFSPEKGQWLYHALPALWGEADYSPFIPQ